MKRLIDIINTDNEPNIINDMVFGDDNVKRNNMKQTAVEWLENKLDIILPLDFEWDKLNNIFNQAKAMEKEQMIKFTNDYLDDDRYLTAEHYYNDTYNK
jgi:hypothetical protein